MVQEEFPALIEDLHKYLQTSIEYGEPENRKRRSDKSEIDVIPVKISVKNTSEKSVEGPDIVFMGINLSFQNKGTNMNLTLRRWIRDCKISHNYGSQNVRHDTMGERLDIAGEAFTPATSDERSHGELLFPGDSIVYEMYMPIKHKGDGYFEISATISRRHLFHIQRVFVENN